MPTHIIGGAETKKRILKYLGEVDERKSLEEIGDALGLCRATISKYVGILEGTGEIEVRRRATMKEVRLVETSNPSKNKGNK